MTPEEFWKQPEQLKLLKEMGSVEWEENGVRLGLHRRKSDGWWYTGLYNQIGALWIT